MTFSTQLRWLRLLAYGHCNKICLERECQVKQRYLDGLYVKVWIERLHAGSD